MIIEKEIIQEAKDKLGEQAAFIIAKDLELENFDEKNLKASCYFHNEKTPSMIWDIKRHMYHCFSCGRNYNILDHFMEHNKMTFLESVQKLFELTHTKYRFGEIGIKSKKNYKYPKREQNISRSKVEEYLALRKISKKTLDYCDVQQDSNGNIAFHYFDENDVLSLVKYRPAKKINKQKGDIKAWSQKDSDTVPILYNMNKIEPTRPLVIVEGELDCLSVIEAGYSNVVSVPFGAASNNWIDHNWDWLQQFEKIITWSDYDEAGIKMRQDVCPRLGNWRTLYIDLSDLQQDKKVKDANEVLYFYGKEKVLELIENASESPLDDFIDIDDIKSFDLESEQGVYTGLKEIDNAINKLYFGNLVIWTGKRGNGKTVIANQIAISEPLNQGYNVAAFSLELPNPMLKSWVDRNIAGRERITMKNDKTPMIDGKTMGEIAMWRKSRCFLYNNEINKNYKHILNRIEEIVRRKGVKSILLDNFMMVDLEAHNSDKYDKQIEFIKELVILARKLYCIIHLVAHPRKTGEQELQNDDISGSGHITDLAQYVFAIKRFKDEDRDGVINVKTGQYYKGKEPHNYDLSATILKNRITGEQDKTAMLHFDYPSYRIYDTPEMLWKRYKWNRDTSPMPDYDPKDKKNTPFD